MARLAICQYLRTDTYVYTALSSSAMVDKCTGLLQVFHEPDRRAPPMRLSTASIDLSLGLQWILISVTPEDGNLCYRLANQHCLTKHVPMGPARSIDDMAMSDDDLIDNAQNIVLRVNNVATSRQRTD